MTTADPPTPTTAETLEDFFGPPISIHTRKQALEDGDLVDLIDFAENVSGYGKTGFTFPLACTRRVFEELIRVPEGSAAERAGQDINGRLHDVLSMLHFAIKRGGHTDRIEYQLHVTRDRVRPTLTTLVALCGPGDDAEPVITIMFPDED